MKLKKRTKLFLTLGAGLMTTTGVVTPLVCSCSTDNNNNDIGGFDKKYNVNDAMISNLEKQCDASYHITLKKQGIRKPAEINKKMEEMKKAFLSLKKKHKRKTVVKQLHLILLLN